MQRTNSECASQLRLANLSIDVLPASEAPTSDGRIADELAVAILSELMLVRRQMQSDTECTAIDCHLCTAPHLYNIKATILALRPLMLVLPAFPGKSPNLDKVLGHLPDLAEQRALQFLNDLCRRIRRLYRPGAQLIICSDGRVFSDIVGMQEDHVTAYQIDLARMIAVRQLDHLRCFNLDELSAGAKFDQVRQQLMDQYGQSLASLRCKVRRGADGAGDRDDLDSHRLYCGITRFLFEDGMYPGQAKSRSAVQKDARARAYKVILRSNAWSELVAERFPTAVRLSIHPQACGSKKLGIRLGGDNSWMTPWHGVAVDTGTQFVLMKRCEAEKLGSTLIRDASGRASHYQLIASGTPSNGAAL